MQPPNRHLWVLLAVGTLTLLTAFAPNASAVAYEEGFESFANFDTPSSSSYTFSTSGTGSSTVRDATAVPAYEGTKSLQVATTGPQFRASLATGSVMDCTTISTSSVSFAFRMSQLPTAGDRYEVGIQTIGTGFDAGAGEYIAVAVTETGDVRGQYQDNGGSFDVDAGSLGFTAATATWYHFTISCTGSTLTWFETTTGVPPLSTSASLTLGKGTFTADIDPLASAAQIYIDAINYGNFVATEPGLIFCSDPGLSPGEDGSVDDFGYEYVEDWTYDSDLATEFGPTDGFVATESDGGSAYMGKGFDTGTKAIAVKFTIEAAVEDQDSVFRVAFTEGNSGTPSGANNGDGTDGGNFDDHVGVRFEEEGNNWRITFRQNIAGAGYNTIGASFTHGNPNTATSYNFTVDSRDLTASLLDSDGDIIATRTIDSSFQDEVWEDQWFVATGTNALLPATTVLDDQSGESETSDGSTCIYDLIGGAEASNTAGGDDQSGIIDTPDEPDEGTGVFNINESNVPEGFTVAAFKGFLGILLVLAIGVGLYFTTGRSTIIAGIGVLGGFLLAYFLGLFEIWIIVVAVIVAIAIVFLKVKGFGSGG